MAKQLVRSLLRIKERRLARRYGDLRFETWSTPDGLGAGSLDRGSGAGRDGSGGF